MSDVRPQTGWQNIVWKLAEAPSMFCGVWCWMVWLPMYHESGPELANTVLRAGPWGVLPIAAVIAYRHILRRLFPWGFRDAMWAFSWVGAFVALLPILWVLTVGSS